MKNKCKVTIDRRLQTGTKTIPPTYHDRPPHRRPNWMISELYLGSVHFRRPEMTTNRRSLPSSSCSSYLQKYTRTYCKRNVVSRPVTRSAPRSSCNIESMVTTSRGVWLGANVRGRERRRGRRSGVTSAPEKIALHRDSPSRRTKAYLVRTW